MRLLSSFLAFHSYLVEVFIFHLSYGSIQIAGTIVPERHCLPYVNRVLPSLQSFATCAITPSSFKISVFFRLSSYHAFSKCSNLLSNIMRTPPLNMVLANLAHSRTGHIILGRLRSIIDSTCWPRVSLVDNYGVAMSWRVTDVRVQVGGARRIVVGMVAVCGWTSGDIDVVVLGAAGGSKTHFVVGKALYVADWRYRRGLMRTIGGSRVMADGFGRNLNLRDKDV